MEIIEIKTLIDITNTKVIRLNQGSQFELDQNRNFITLMQCIELRSIVSYDITPVIEKIDIKSLGFGTAYKGKQNVWTFNSAWLYSFIINIPLFVLYNSKMARVVKAM